MAALIVLIGLVLLALLAPIFGADSRDGLDWSPAALGGGSDRWQREARSGRPPSLPGRLTAFGRKLAAIWLEYEYAHEVLWRAQQPWLDEQPSGAKDSLRWRRGLLGRWRLTGRLLPPTGGQLRR